MGEPNDADLVVAAVAGNARAFQSLVERYLPVVEGFLLGRVPPEMDIEDLVQEIFLSAYQHLGRIRDPNRFGPWLLRITRNHLYDMYKRERIRRTRDVAAGAKSDPVDLATLVDQNQNPGELTESREILAAIEESLARLNDKLRPVVYLRLREGKNSQEVSELLGLKASTVRMRLKKGLQVLRSDLARRGWEPK